MLSLSQAVDALITYFDENPDAIGYFTSIDVDGNSKVGYI